MVIINNRVYGQMQFSPLLTGIGGLLFGPVMALSGNCCFGALSRFGCSDLKSFFIVLVMGIAAYTVYLEVLSPLTVWLRETLIISETTPSFF